MIFHAPGCRGNARGNSRRFNDHRYGQGPPVLCARTMWHRLRLVKYFHHAKTDLRSDIQRHHNSKKPHLQKGSGGGTCRRASSSLLHGSLEAKASSPIINCYISITITIPISSTAILLEF